MVTWLSIERISPIFASISTLECAYSAVDESRFSVIKFFTPMGSGNYNFPNMGARLGMPRVLTLLTPAFHLLEGRRISSNPPLASPPGQTRPDVWLSNERSAAGHRRIHRRGFAPRWRKPVRP